MALISARQRRRERNTVEADGCYHIPRIRQRRRHATNQNSGESAVAASRRAAMMTPSFMMRARYDSARYVADGTAMPPPRRHARSRCRAKILLMNAPTVLRRVLR